MKVILESDEIKYEPKSIVTTLVFTPTSYAGGVIVTSSDKVLVNNKKGALLSDITSMTPLTVTYGNSAFTGGTATLTHTKWDKVSEIALKDGKGLCINDGNLNGEFKLAVTAPAVNPSGASDPVSQYKGNFKIITNQEIFVTNK